MKYNFILAAVLVALLNQPAEALSVKEAASKAKTLVVASVDKVRSTTAAVLSKAASVVKGGASKAKSKLHLSKIDSNHMLLFTSENFMIN